MTTPVATSSWPEIEGLRQKPVRFRIQSRFKMLSFLHTALRTIVYDRLNLSTRACP